mmetsp:Transcript_30115/g.65724  ORF Transcript_30115/g.65724 Transcript_30115/m.65724 type:complete len:241 (-) Transcript_30115:1457-2179(-)
MQARFDFHGNALTLIEKSLTVLDYLLPLIKLKALPLHSRLALLALCPELRPHLAQLRITGLELQPQLVQLDISLGELPLASQSRAGAPLKLEVPASQLGPKRLHLAPALPELGLGGSVQLLLAMPLATRISQKLLGGACTGPLERRGVHRSWGSCTRCGTVSGIGILRLLKLLARPLKRAGSITSRTLCPRPGLQLRTELSNLRLQLLYHEGTCTRLMLHPLQLAPVRICSKSANEIARL